MIGGFLGAGKTTAVLRAARTLTDRGLRVGLITNDQSTGLVDTAMLRSHGFAVEEIAGGCFCCRFPSLQEAAGRLDESTRPDVFLAEPVGSCTDLVATVSYPLRRIYGDRFKIAPLSVLVDPTRAARILGLVEGKAFSENVSYVYLKQLEEADVIVVNKIDALDEGLRTRLVEALDERFPAARVLCASAKEGTGMDPWIEHMMTGAGATRATMELDYDTYADGEARLGWLNATYAASSDAPFDGNALLLDLTERLRARLQAEDAEIAHLKMTLDSGGPMGMLSVVSVVGSDREPDLRESLLDLVPGGHLVVNLRAEMDPTRMSSILDEEIRKADVGLAKEHEEYFKPARPEPTHRVSVEAS